MTPSGRRIQGKGLDPDLTVMPLKLEKLAPGDRRREADLRGALKNTDPLAPSGKDTGAKLTPRVAAAADEAPSVATEDMGSASDEQLSEAADVLRGLALVSGRAG
jgi:carboxyl-terminal processing protease